jgi:DNA (cytosine-5)-methyltransferase 1
MTLTHGSLFAGIGGFDLGFERAGIKTVWQVELDAYCRRVLEKHFPAARRFADIRECGARNLERVDILSGGFPCQDISNAGKRAGIDGERSGLWSEYARIVGELRPHFVVVENVAALLHRGMERVLGDLAAIRYDAEWESIRASDVGAPHRRERIWIVAYPQCERGYVRADEAGRKHGRANETFATSEPGSDVLADAERMFAQQFAGAGTRSSEKESGQSPGKFTGRSENVADANGRRLAVQGESSGRSGFATRGSEDVSHTDGRREQPGGAPRDERRFQNETLRSLRHSDNWAIEPDVGRVAHGVPARVDRLRGLGNAIVPQIAHWIGQKIVAAHDAGNSPARV